MISDYFMCDIGILQGDKENTLELPIDIQSNLFEKLVFPIMLYGCEIWGSGPQDMLEIFYRKFIFKSYI